MRNQKNIPYALHNFEKSPAANTISGGIKLA